MYHWHKCKGSLKRISLMKFVQDAVHLLIVYTYIYNTAQLCPIPVVIPVKYKVLERNEEKK